MHKVATKGLTVQVNKKDKCPPNKVYLDKKITLQGFMMVNNRIQQERRQMKRVKKTEMKVSSNLKF